MRRGAVCTLGFVVAIHLVARAGEGGAASTTTPSAIHGFVSVAFKNAYVTPRGLVVTTSGLTVQPLAGLKLVLLTHKRAVDELSLVTGAWNDVCSCQHDAFVDGWNELDYFGGLSLRLVRKLELGLYYLLFLSPPHFFAPQHNLELRSAFDDSAYLKGFGFHPYFKLFYAVAGDSTVALGRKGDTFDVELGLTPGYAFVVAGEPIAFSVPTYLTLGGPGFFGDGGVLGVFSMGPSVAFPLGFIPAQLGTWQLSGSISWYHLIDDHLVAASKLLGNGSRRDGLIAMLELGMSY